MVCTTCGAVAGDGARFCASCGASLSAVCAACGSAAEPGARFCASCGAPLDVASPAAAPVAEERKIITCLYADLVGSTASADGVDPEDVRARLTPYHNRLRDELERFGGTVEKFIGDAVVALFGAPVAHEDDPERAVRAALAIQAAIAELNAADRSLDFAVRVGVATGEALVRLDVDPHSGEGLASGDVMNTGARLQSAAPPGGILVGEKTFGATQHAIEYLAADAVQAKGKAEPLRAWQPVGQRDGGRSLDRDAPLVGRGHELELLVQTLDRARRTKRTQLVTIVGVPGIGKSRLVFELFSAAEEAGMPLLRLQGRSLPYGEGISFHALAEMAKAHAEIYEADSAQIADEKLRAAVDAVVTDPADARWIAEHLRPLVGVASNGGLGDDRTEAFAAWRRWIEMLAERTPVALVFEDLHWADDALLDFVDHVVDWSSDVPLLVVGTTRPELYERRAGWGGGKWNAFSIALAPLSDDATGELVAALLERVVLHTNLRALLIDRAGGNPLYAGQYVRMLADRGLLPTNGDGHELPDAQLPLPETVQGIIAARLDALPAEEKALLHDAAVFGEVFWIGALAAVASLPRATVERLLHALERKEFVRRERRSSVAEEHQYAFRHVLVRDVAYGQVSRARRSERHRLAAEWIKSVARDRADDRAEMLAHHYLTALALARATRVPVEGLEEPARRAAVEAGAHAAGLYAYPAAARFLEAALELTPPDDPARADLLLRLGRARLHAEAQGAEELEQARAAFLERGDASQAAVADVLLSVLRTNEGRRGDGLDHIRRAGALVDGEEPSRTKALVLSTWSRALMRVGDAAESTRVGRNALALAEELELDDLRVHALSTIGAARLVAGDSGGLTEITRSLEIARELNSPEVARCCRLLGGALTIEGDLERAYELFAEARRTADRFGDAFERRWLAAVLVVEHYWSGRWDAALQVAEAFIAEADRGVHHYMETSCRRARGLIRIACGDLPGATDDAERALAISRTTNDPWFLNQAIAFRARTAARVGDTDAAGRLADELLEIWMRPEGATAPAFDAVDMAMVLTSLGREHDLEQVARGRRPTRWLEAALALARAEFTRAAEAFAAIGSVPDEATARLAAARASGDGDDLERALGFFRRVGATAYVRDAEEPAPR